MSWQPWVQRKFERLFTYERWNIGYGVQTAEELIQDGKVTDKITWLTEDAPEYAADPFGVTIDGETLIYFEELSFWNGKGQLMVIKLGDIKSKKRVTGIDDSIHLSYPYIFEDAGNVYCIPETGSKNEVALYTIDKKNPQKLSKVSPILYGEHYVDSSMIFYNDKYWLFTSLSGHSDQLYIYYSDKLSGKFIPHLKSPIDMVSDTGRGAGRPFIVKNKLYLPCQNPEKCYGGSVIIYEITSLSSTSFDCKKSFEILPKAPYKEGLHTLNFQNGLVIIDGKRIVISLLATIKKLCKKLRNR